MLTTKTIIIALGLCIQCCYGDVSQPADPAANILFPHKILPRTDGHLPGHLEQLGHQRPPVGQIPEYFEPLPTPRELWDKQVKLYRPAVLRGALKGSPALEKWTDEYLTSEYGDQEVLIEKKYEDRKTEPKRMTIKDFLQQYHNQSWYVVSILPNVMRRDVKVPKPLMCSTFRKNLEELNLWIGTRGTRSMLHHDADNIMHCVVAGRKDWILIHPENKPKIDMVAGRRGQHSGFSHLNVDSIDETINPEVWDVWWEYVTLYGGDCLYLPPQYEHQVRSYNRSISATFLFYPRNVFTDDDCKDVDLDGYMSLNETYVTWTYDKNQETVDMGYMNPRNVRRDFMNVINGAGVEIMTSRDFLHIAMMMHEDAVIQKINKVSKFFRSIDTNGDMRVSKQELLDMDLELWKDWCREVDDPHGPTKSNLNNDKNLSSEVSDFNPRPFDYYKDSDNALSFLKFVVRIKGKDNAIKFPEFKKWVEITYGTASDAFLTVDRDFDGVLTIQELDSLHRKFLRDFNRLGYKLKGTTIHGGGLFIEEQEENDLTRLDKLDYIPEKYFEKEEDLSEELHRRADEAVVQYFVDLKEFVEQQPEKQIDQENFEKFMADSKFPRMVEVRHFDSTTAFHFLDRGQKGFITVDDVTFYQENKLFSPSSVETVEKLARVFEEKPQDFYPMNFFSQLTAAMNQVHELLEYMKKIKEKKQKDQKQDKEQGKKERREREESEHEESDGESGDESGDEEKANEKRERKEEL